MTNKRRPEPDSAARFCGFAQGPRANSLGNKDSILGSGERVSIVIPLKSTLHWILILIIGAFAGYPSENERQEDRPDGHNRLIVLITETRSSCKYLSRSCLVKLLQKNCDDKLIKI